MKKIASLILFSLILLIIVFTFYLSSKPKLNVVSEHSLDLTEDESKYLKSSKSIQVTYKGMTGNITLMKAFDSKKAQTFYNTLSSYLIEALELQGYSIEDVKIRGATGFLATKNEDVAYFVLLGDRIISYKGTDKERSSEIVNLYVSTL